MASAPWTVQNICQTAENKFLATSHQPASPFKPACGRTIKKERGIINSKVTLSACLRLAKYNSDTWLRNIRRKKRTFKKLLIETQWEENLCLPTDDDDDDDDDDDNDDEDDDDDDEGTKQRQAYFKLEKTDSHCHKDEQAKRSGWWPFPESSGHFSKE